MENPVKEISGVIHLLTQSPPSIQRETIDTYFTPDATFTHPFCRTGSWDNSRFLIQVIYRWYKIMSPRIEMTVNSIAFDEPNSTLYISLHQIFRIRVIPLHASPVNLTTVLTLRFNRGDEKYYIASQNDLYQVNEFFRFLFPFGWVLVWVWQVCATLFCLLGALVLAPVSWIEEKGWEGSESGGYGVVKGSRLGEIVGRGKGRLDGEGGLLVDGDGEGEGGKKKGKMVDG
ncbi:unnamed protein product [Periconia digitata]|uniref:SigF-like NTF2-like domain-containing protein n=1 Tax=Periconia digitata TaxID=1303443 RepID=A0A9W4UH40_9PLEO|nr:unnamed protein product [Periconia digitata]